MSDEDFRSAEEIGTTPRRREPLEEIAANSRAQQDNAGESNFAGSQVEGWYLLDTDHPTFNPDGDYYCLYDPDKTLVSVNFPAVVANAELADNTNAWPAFCMDDDGWVSMKGLISCNYASASPPDPILDGGLLFTLPADYVPNETEAFLIAAYTTTATRTFRHLVITGLTDGAGGMANANAGQVRMYGGNVDRWISLSGVRFRSAEASGAFTATLQPHAGVSSGPGLEGNFKSPCEPRPPITT